MKTVGINKQIQTLGTERYGDQVTPLDLMSAMEIVTIINDKDKVIAHKIEKVLPEIARASEEIAARFTNGGRIIYVGAGSSGRIGVLDAVELGPTYDVDASRAFGLLAGKEKAMFVAIEGSEDDRDMGRQDIVEAKVNELDVVIGIAASGRTPYTDSALQEAKARNAYTIAVTSNKDSLMSITADLAIEVDMDPEIVAGSTRMGSGTAQKMILNMLSTTSMILSGRVYNQYMVYVRATNEKLIQRSILLIQQITGVDQERAIELFEKSNHVVATAIVMELGQVDAKTAKHLLEVNKGKVRGALSDIEASLR